MEYKKMLEQYADLKAEIKNLERRIRQLEQQVDKIEHDFVTGSSHEFPYTPRTFHIEGYSEKRRRRLASLKRLLAARKDACEELQLKIEEFIHSIPDSRTRRVFQYRYIDGLSWQAIAFKIGRHDESYPRKVIHDKFLEEIQ